MATAPHKPALSHPTPNPPRRSPTRPKGTTHPSPDIAPAKRLPASRVLSGRPTPDPSHPPDPSDPQPTSHHPSRPPRPSRPSRAPHQIPAPSNTPRPDRTPHTRERLSVNPVNPVNQVNQVNLRPPRPSRPSRPSRPIPSHPVPSTKSFQSSATEAPTARPIAAQGNALGQPCIKPQRPERAP